MNLEHEPLPYGDGAVDVVVCNQVFEHLKQIFHPMQEIHRVLRPNGWLVFSVPNLASLHNRILLALGMQPTSIRMMGPHVRGFTHRATRRFLAFQGHFEVVRGEGVGMYPFPMGLGGRVLGRLLPGMAHTSVFLARRRAPSGAGWDSWMQDSGVQTVYRESGEGRPPTLS
jgi:SAM-dependent methyltransferase